MSVTETPEEWGLLGRMIVDGQTDLTVLAIEIERWQDHNRLLEADLLAGDFSEGTPAQLHNGIRFGEEMLRIIVRQVERVERAAFYRANPQAADDLHARFTKARKVPMHEVVSRLTGRWARLGPRDRYWMCCPLPGHDEDTPSFKFEEDGRWYCFGCHRGGGDAASFAAAYMGSTQVEGLRLIEELFP